MGGEMKQKEREWEIKPWCGPKDWPTHKSSGVYVTHLSCLHMNQSVFNFPHLL